MKHERNDPLCGPWDSQGDEKMQCLFLLLFVLTLIRNENITSEESKSKNHLK